MYNMAQSPQTLDFVTQSINHLPEHIANPVGLAASVAVAGAYIAFEWWRFNPDRQSGLAHEAANPGAVRKAVIDVESVTDGSSKLYDRWYRIGSRLLIAAGVGLFVGTLLGKPEYNSPESSGSSKTAVVLESAGSMIYTHDTAQGPSRFNLAVDGIIGSGYQGKMAVEQFGVNDNLSQPLISFDPKTIKMNVTPGLVNPYGANLVPAMIAGANALEGSHAISSHDTEIIISDGLVEDSPQSIAAEANYLDKKGIHTEVIVVGSKNSQYIDSVGASPYSAAPKYTSFADMNQQDVFRVNNANQISHEIGRIVSQADKTPISKPWYPAYIPGILLGAAGFIKDGMQRFKKYV